MISEDNYIAFVLPRQTRQFGKQDATMDEVVDTGDASLVCLHNGKDGDNLDALSYAKFCSNVATNTARIRPHTLPPTSAAARCGYTCWYNSG